MSDGWFEWGSTVIINSHVLSAVQAYWIDLVSMQQTRNFLSIAFTPEETNLRFRLQLRIRDRKTS